MIKHNNTNRAVLIENIDALRNIYGNFIVETVILEKISPNDINSWIGALSSHMTWAKSHHYNVLAAGFERALDDIQTSLGARGLMKKVLTADIAKIVAKSQAMVDAIIRGFEVVEHVVELIDGKYTIQDKETPLPKALEAQEVTGGAVGGQGKESLKNKDLQGYANMIARAMVPGNLFGTIGIKKTPYISSTADASWEIINNSSYDGLKTLAQHSEKLRSQARVVPPAEITQISQRQQTAAQQQQPAEQQPAAVSSQQEPAQQHTVSRDQFIKNVQNTPEKEKKRYYEKAAERLARAAINNAELGWAIKELDMQIR